MPKKDFFNWYRSLDQKKRDVFDKKLAQFSTTNDDNQVSEQDTGKAMPVSDKGEDEKNIDNNMQLKTSNIQKNIAKLRSII